MMRPMMRPRKGTDMAYYMATICIDRGAQNDQDGRQIVVHWDDKNPNSAITAPIMYAHPITSELVLEVLLRDEGWTVVSRGSDNIGRGFAIVKRTDTRHPFFNPVARAWQMFLTDSDKEEIRTKYPDADVPCVPRGPIHLWNRVNGYYTTRH